MAKIERVIEVFECLLDIDKPCNDTCSYSLGDCMCDTTRLYKETLELLKEQQPKHGHWIEQEGFDGDVYYDCSVCGESWVTVEGTPEDNGMIYCPHCGAKMDEQKAGEQE